MIYDSRIHWNGNKLKIRFRNHFHHILEISQFFPVLAIFPRVFLYFLFPFLEPYIFPLKYLETIPLAQKFPDSVLIF